MTQQNKTSLQALFQTGDIPQGNDYSDFIDSCINVAETSAQAMQGPINPTELITPRVSAANARITGTVSALTVYADNLYSSGLVAIGAVLQSPVLNGGVFVNSVSAEVNGALLVTGALTVTGNVSASTGTIYASAMRSTNGFIGSVGVVSAAGTTQGAAAILTNVTNRGKGIADGVTTGFAPLANRAGLVQYLFNEGASANLWPPTGGTINGLAANAVFPLAASAMVTIVHLTASAYAVK